MSVLFPAALVEVRSGITTSLIPYGFGNRDPIVPLKNMSMGQLCLLNILFCWVCSGGLENATKLCTSKTIVTVNGKFRGRLFMLDEGDNVLVRVTIMFNTMHGVRQLRTGWLTDRHINRSKRDTPWHAHILAESNRAWCHCYLAKKRCPLSVSETRQGKGHRIRGMVESRYRSSGEPGYANRLPRISDAHMINGHPGPVPNVLLMIHTLHVETEKTYLIRVNAAVNDELFFKIAHHNLTVVEVDASYTKPYTTDTFLGRDKPQLHFLKQIRALAMDHSLFSPSVSGINPCATCFNSSRAVASINNISFVMPTTAPSSTLLWNKRSFHDDFPGKPLIRSTIRYSTIQSTNNNGTKVYRLAYNSTVQLVIQGNNIVAPESHPTHLHGFNFFVVGRGVGNFDPEKDPSEFNLIDPVERNTVSVPTSGWTVIRFRADNQEHMFKFQIMLRSVDLGIWFFHCHLEVHTTWGLKMAFLVENGEGPDESIEPPPSDLPKC
ncbi:Laccase-2 [Hibiscus syriacus]|uniref:Laccase-2 n=1 Tax=Hibiscus syriacus TaxID=106335 RepID=A0A6A2X316_HIBSY|nr:Laccase-2 [Hibiscus syriacus]